MRACMLVRTNGHEKAFGVTMYNVRNNRISDG